MRSRPVVAIDGPSGVGKSTVAKGLAKALGFAFVDTGALYRTVAWLADAQGVDWNDGASLGSLVDDHDFTFNSEGELYVDGVSVGDRIRTPRMSRGASTVARHSHVRKALLTLQRNIGRDGGVVLEGRDIGTVVFPDAEMKFFLTASARVRAERRFLELTERGEQVSLDEVERELERRDEADSTRTHSPLKKAQDAQEMFSDSISAQEVIKRMLKRVQANFPLTSN